jgi:hypothetical protein
MLIYFCDHAENGMSGGELIMHPVLWKRWLQPAVKIEPRENLMLAFPCTDRSYHSVPPITAMERPRNYMQVQISSSVDIWPRSSH